MNLHPFLSPAALFHACGAGVTATAEKKPLAEGQAFCSEAAAMQAA
jgi:hypothetical protein